MWQRHRRCSSRELRTRYCRDHQYWYVRHLSVVFTLFSRLCARVCVCADSHELRSALTISLLLKIQTNSSPVFNILSFLPSNDHQRQSILFLFVFAAERITGSQNRVLTQEIVRTRRQIIWWAALGLAIFGMLGELVVQTSFIAFKTNSKWHEELMQVLGFVKLRSVLEYVMEFVPLFLVAISAAGKLHLSRERELALLDGIDAEEDGVVLVDPFFLRDRALIRCAFTAGIAAAAVPSITGIPYFLFAAIFLTSWGLLDKRKLVRPPAFILVVAMAYACVHFMLIVCYQLPQLHDSANKTFASWIGLYIMDGSDGPVIRGMRLLQLFTIAGFFSSVCEASANEDIVDEVQYNQDGSITEGLDDIDEPLISHMRSSDRETSEATLEDPGVQVRLLAKFSGGISACAIILSAITAPSALACPILLFSLMSVLYPPTHREFSKLLAPSALIYVALWSFVEFIVQAIPETDNNSFFLVLGLSRQENDWIGSLRMASVFTGMTILAYFSRLARGTPNETALQAAASMQEESLPSSFVFVNAEYDNVDYDFDEDGFTPSESGWAGVAASFASKLLIPLLLWLVALSRDDIIHAGLFCLFLLTIAKPGKTSILIFTSRIMAMLIACMYLWSLDTLPALLGRRRFSKFEDFLKIIGLWNEDVVRSMWPMALVLFVDVAVIHMPGIIRALSHLFPGAEDGEMDPSSNNPSAPANIDDESSMNSRRKRVQALPKIKVLISAILSEFWISSKRVLNFTGAYSVLIIGLFTVLTNECSLLNLALLLFLGGALVVPFDTIEDRNRRSVRWGALFTFALANLAVRYAFGAFPLARWVGMNSEAQDFLANNVGLEPNLPRNKLMTSLLGPSLLLIATHFHRIGLLRNEPTSLLSAGRESDQPIRLVIAGTQKGRIPMIKRICILHCDKFLTLVALGFSFQRGVDIIGGLMLFALMCTLFSPKLARTSEILGAVAILSALLEYTYNIDWIHRALSDNEDTMSWIGAQYYPLREVDPMKEEAIWPRNERMLLWPVFVLVAVEFCRISRNWLVKLPPALKSGCAPEPCHLFWPPRNPEARSAALKRSTITKRTPFRRMDSIPDDHELVSEDVNSEDGTSTSTYLETYLSGDRSESLRARAKRLLFQKARTSIDQLNSLFFILPEFVEGALALLMPGLAYVVFGTVGIASGNVLSLVYLGLMLQMMEKEQVFTAPSNRLKVWKLVSFVCGVALFWQYIASMGEYPKDNGKDDFSEMPQTPPSPSGNNSSSDDAALGKSEREYETDELLVWFGLVKRSKYMLLGHFLAFFVAACQLRMDSVLASMEERARTAVIAENPDLEEEQITEAATLMLPRRTPTQLALLPRRPGDPTLKIFSALTWEATSNWTILDWTRYYIVRYSREAAFILVIVAGTCMNDVIHAGYLILSVSILKNRTWDRVDELLVWMKRYNLLIMGSVLAYQAPFESLVGVWFANRENTLCSLLHLIGFYRVDSVLGFDAGQLGPDLFIFATMSCLRYLISSHEYAAVLEMDRQARSRTKTGDKAETWKRVRKYYLQCLKAMREREDRHKRVEEIRNDIQNLSLEVVRLENMQQKDRSSEAVKQSKDEDNGDGEDDRSVKTPSISESKLRHRKVAGARPKIDDWVEEQAKTPPRETPWEGIDRSFAGSDTIQDSETYAGGGGESVASDVKEDANNEDEEKLEDLIDEFIRGDRRSVFGFIVAGIIDIWPWVSAPESSLVYFFYFLAFAMNFSLITVVYPTSLVCAALIASPKPGPKFWRFMLRYSETVIVLSYILSIPCSKACFSWKLCGQSNIIGVPDFSQPFVVSTLPLFLAYFATLLHSFGQGGVYELKPRYDTWLSSTYVPTEDEIVENSENILDEAVMEEMSPRSRYGIGRRGTLPDFENLRRSGNDYMYSRDSFQNISRNLDTFFQRLLTDETEFGPSFLSISILDTEDHTEDDWTKIGNDLNFALLQLQDFENANNADYYSLDLVETDVKGTLHQKGHRTAVFQVVAPLTILTPAADAANGVKKLQLREASAGLQDKGENVMPDLPGITSVRAFHREPENFYGITATVDIIAALFALFFYQSSIEADPQALIETVSQGLFPQDYVFTMFFILVLLLVDAVIYLKRAKAAKVFYHYTTFAFYTTGLLILYHKSTTSNHEALRVFFLIKCLSFATSARQLRCGFPVVVNESLRWLKRRNEEFASILFGIYYSIPFLYELKVLLDFACTASSLDIFDWLKLEDINRSLFEIDIRNKTYYKRYPFGKPQPTWKKVYLEGGGLFVLLFAALVVPFFVFSTSNPQVGPNPVLETRMNITFVSPSGSSAFEVFAGGNRRTIQSEEWMSLNTDSVTPPPVRHPNQIQDACLSPDSDKIWALPPPAMKDFSNSIVAGTEILTYWNFRRALPLDNRLVTAGGRSVVLQEREAEKLRKMISGEDDDAVLIKGLYPRVWRVLGKGDPVREISTNQFVDCSFKLNALNTSQPWWSVGCGVNVKLNSGDNIFWEQCKDTGSGPEIILISSEVATGAFAQFSKIVGGLTGMYVAYILAIGTFIRGMTSNLVTKIPHQDLPCTRRLTALCEDIYVMRNAGEHLLEERLYWLLIRIYRSPTVLFEFTRTERGDAEPERPQRRFIEH